MVLVQAVCNVLIHPDNVPARMATKARNVMPLVGVIQLVQVVQHVMLLQVNVIVTLDTQEPHVILVPPITIEQVMEHVQVRDVNIPCLNYA